MKDGQETRINMLRDEVIGFFQFTSSAMPQLEEVYALYLDHAFEEIAVVSRKKDLQVVSLESYFDTAFYGVEIIHDDHVVNATDAALIGQKRKIDTVKDDHACLMRSFLLDPEAKRIKSVEYRKHKDSDYTIGISVYARIGDAMIRLFKNRLDTIQEKYEDIVSINVWIKDDSLVGLDNEPMYNEFMDSLLHVAFNQNKDLHEHFRIGKRHFVGHLLYLGKAETNFMDKSVVISILSDVTGFAIPVRNIIRKQVMITLSIFILLVFIIVMTTRDYRIMLKDIVQKTGSIAQGNMSERVKEKGNNEFTTLAERFNLMVEKLEVSYNELNEKNKLIQEHNEELSQQNEEITSQRDEIEAQRDEIEAQRNLAIEQKDIIEKQKNEMLDSITYAQRIQEAALPHEFYINEILPDNFIFFQPRDIVSGDFYWIKQIDEHIIIVAADCTGHGVPGSIMSILGISLLNEIVQHKRIIQPHLILNEMRKQIKRSLRQSGKKNEAKDGMDMAICSVNTNTSMLQYAGAFNPLIMVRNKEIVEYKADRMPVGIHMREKPTFTNHTIALQPGDTMYVFSDGFPDQLGGSQGKKFMIKNLKKLFIEMYETPLFEQKEKLNQVLKDWMKDEEQIDDILIVGFRII